MKHVRAMTDPETARLSAEDIAGDMAACIGRVHLELATMGWGTIAGQPLMHEIGLCTRVITCFRVAPTFSGYKLRGSSRVSSFVGEGLTLLLFPV